MRSWLFKASEEVGRGKMRSTLWGLGVAAMVAWGGEAASTVVVQPGDTLWTIAAERYPGDDTRARIDEIERMNNLSSPVIVVGETLRLPA